MVHKIYIYKKYGFPILLIIIETGNIFLGQDIIFSHSWHFLAFRCHKWERECRKWATAILLRKFNFFRCPYDRKFFCENFIKNHIRQTTIVNLFLIIGEKTAWFNVIKVLRLFFFRHRHFTYRNWIPIETISLRRINHTERCLCNRPYKLL